MAEKQKFSREELEGKKVAELKELLTIIGGNPKGLLKDKVISAILEIQTKALLEAEKSATGASEVKEKKIKRNVKKQSGNPDQKQEGDSKEESRATVKRVRTERIIRQANKRILEKQVQSLEEKKRYEPSDPSDDVIAMLSNGEAEERSGVLEIHQEGYGFLRARNFESGPKDAYLSSTQIKRFGLRRGDMVSGLAKKPTDSKPAPMLVITRVNDRPSEPPEPRPHFDNLVPIHPDEQYKLEIFGEENDVAIRAIDLVSPIGKGQRGIIVSPPKAGKTTLLKKIANSISVNYPKSKLFVLLIDERPEEVTDMQRSIKGEVVYSTFDEQPEHHIKAAELLLQRAKRLVETGEDVVILLDSLTRLARAYNLVVPASGKTLSGGIDPTALYGPKRFFGSARNIENGGSLTIIATALVETNSRLDEVIFEEFKGTGNMEIHLDRRLSEKRIFPAINLNKSSTRREELLLSKNFLDGIWTMRKMLSSGDGQEATESLLNMISKTKNNEEFIKQLGAKLAVLQKEGYTLRG